MRKYVSKPIGFEFGKFNRDLSTKLQHIHEMLPIPYVESDKVYATLCRFHSGYQNLVTVEVVRGRKNRSNTFASLLKMRFYKQMHESPCFVSFKD